jgi:hypothetical protein
MDFSRLRQGEIIAGLAGVALIITMFLDWYGVGDDGVSAWDSLTDFDGFLIAAAGVAGIVLALLAAAGRKLNLGDLPRGCVTAALGAIAVALIVWRMFADPAAGGDLDLEFGIFLGLASAIGVTVGATMALREGGFEPLSTVAGGRTRSAPATTARAAAAPAARSSSSSRSTSTRKKSPSTRKKSTSSRSGSRSRSTGSRRSSGGRK